MVDNMPYVIGDEIASQNWKNNVKWEHNDRWKSFTGDLGFLDGAAQRVELYKASSSDPREEAVAAESKFDLEFVDLIQNYPDAETVGRRYNKILTSDQEINEFRKVVDQSPGQVERFFAAYPYLSYVLLMLYPRTTIYAVEGGHTKYLTPKMLNMINPLVLAVHIHSEPVARFIDQTTDIFSKEHYKVGNKSVVATGSYELLKYLKSTGRKLDAVDVRVLFHGIGDDKTLLLMEPAFLDANNLSNNLSYPQQLLFILTEYDVPIPTIRIVWRLMLSEWPYAIRMVGRFRNLSKNCSLFIRFDRGSWRDV